MAEWISEKSTVKLHWDRMVLGWETHLGTQGAAIFPSVSCFQSAAGEIYGKL